MPQILVQNGSNKESIKMDCSIWLLAMFIHGFRDILWHACLSTKHDDDCLTSLSTSDRRFSDKKFPSNSCYTVTIHQYSVLQSQLFKLFFAVASPHLKRGTILGHDNKTFYRKHIYSEPVNCALPYRTHLFFQQESWHPYEAGWYVWVCTHLYWYTG